MWRGPRTITYALLGAHVNTALDGLDRVLAIWRPPLVVSLDHSDVWRRVKAESPSTQIVGRLALSGEPDFNDPALDPGKAARNHCDAILPAAARMGQAYDFWQGVNEPVVQSLDATRRLAEFEAERARIMSSQGFRVVVGSFGVGNPPQLAWWQGFLPALEAVKQFEGALALHEYAWPTLDHESPWYLLRHRKVYEGEPAHSWSGLPAHLARTPLLITESGLDGLIVQSKPQGWKAACGQDMGRYMRQLSWYDRELQKDPYVVGAALYCCCTVDDPKWASYNLWPEVVQALAQGAHPVYRPARFPAPVKETVLQVPAVPVPSPPESLCSDDRWDEVMPQLDRILTLLRERRVKS